jgi:hypothetical protein
MQLQSGRVRRAAVIVTQRSAVDEMISLAVAEGVFSHKLTE